MEKLLLALLVLGHSTVSAFSQEKQFTIRQVPDIILIFLHQMMVQ